MISVKLDENLGQSAMELLQKAGYSVDRGTNEGLSGAKDPVVWQRVCQEGRFFITLDLDFSDVRRFPPGTHPGLLLLRPKDRSRDAVVRVLKRVLQEHPLSNLTGCLVVADEHRTRLRRPPSATMP